jgi:predicted ester cyclase
MCTLPLDPIAYKPYADPDDFIREVTDLIWVDRAIGYIRENYEPDSIVHGAYGTSTTRDEVIEGCLMRIAEFPDRIGQADDVVWETRGDEAFLSSHLILSADPATEFLSRTIANCLYRRGRMVEEWVVRDSLAIALQLGLDPDAVARDKVFRGYVGSFVEPAQPDVIAAGDSGPRPDAFRPEVDMVLEFIERVWNDRDLEKLRDFMVRDLTLHTVGYRTFIRPEGYRRSLLSLLRSFPSGRFEVRDIVTNFAERYAGLRIAVLWKFSGRYNGFPAYGPTNNAAVDVLGISQFLIQSGRIVREIRLFDEIALRTQIIKHASDDGIVTANIY